MIGPTGEPTIPASDPSYTKIVTAWGKISARGRELMLKERDLVILVVSSDGDWLYRTSGIVRLRSMYGANNAPKNQDLASLLEILDSPKFQELQEFFYKQRQQFGAASTAPTTLCPVLAGWEAAFRKEDKDWFQAIAGAEVLSWDGSRRKTAVMNSKCGSSFRDAVAVAEDARVRQLRLVANGDAKGTVGIGDVWLALPEQSGEAAKIGTLDERFVSSWAGQSKKILLWSTSGGTVFVTPKSSYADLKPEFTKSWLNDLLKQDRAEVFVAWHGATSVFRVQANK
jgi:hypothetical protein